jgi:hypothetical protein
MPDGTLDRYATDEASEIERNAYNAAFYELGLKWCWDTDTYRQLLAHAGEKERIRVYLETRQPHLLTAYDADFLVGIIETTKARCHRNMLAYGTNGRYKVDWAALQCAEIGV